MNMRIHKSQVPDKGYTELKVEKNVPIPTRSVIYPFDQMEIGDSFFVQTNQPSSTRTTLYAQIKRDASPIRIMTRRVDNGIRVWRIE